MPETSRQVHSSLRRCTPPRVHIRPVRQSPRRYRNRTSSALNGLSYFLPTILQGVICNQVRQRARPQITVVDVFVERFTSLLCCRFGREVLHSAYLLFPIGLSITVAEHPNSRASLPLFPV